jgi:hypothetical protein
MSPLFTDVDDAEFECVAGAMTIVEAQFPGVHG